MCGCLVSYRWNTWVDNWGFFFFFFLFRYSWYTETAEEVFCSKFRGRKQRNRRQEKEIEARVRIPTKLRGVAALWGYKQGTSLNEEKRTASWCHQPVCVARLPERVLDVSLPSFRGVRLWSVRGLLCRGPGKSLEGGGEMLRHKASLAMKKEG